CYPRFLPLSLSCTSFLSNAPSATDIYTLSLHDALPIWCCCQGFYGSHRPHVANNRCAAGAPECHLQHVAAHAVLLWSPNPAITRVGAHPGRIGWLPW